MTLCKNDVYSRSVSVLNERGLWGKGVYFARDAVYSIECPGCCDDCYDDEGNKMIMLCLVQTGLPTIGEEHLTEAPKVHEGMRPKIRRHVRRLSVEPRDVRCTAGQESGLPGLHHPLLVTMGEQAYPAYIIHFDG